MFHKFLFQFRNLSQTSLTLTNIFISVGCWLIRGSSRCPTNHRRRRRISPPNRLRKVARYAEELVEHKERETRIEENQPEGEFEERPEDLPDDVPTKATITTKEINDNHTTTGSGERATKSSPSIKVQSTPMSDKSNFHGCNLLAF